MTNGNSAELANLASKHCLARTYKDGWIFENTDQLRAFVMSALSVYADGGKGEAVQNVMNIPLDAAATMADYAPQAECAPREAQPVAWIHPDDLAAMKPNGRLSAPVYRLPCDTADLIPLCIATPTPERAQSISDAMMDLVDRLGSEASEVDPRAWKHLLVYAPERAQESAGVLTDDQIREIWMRETGTTEQDSPLAVLDFARAVLAKKEGA
jgi:hypothetical protein